MEKKLEKIIEEMLANIYKDIKKDCHKDDLHTLTNNYGELIQSIPNIVFDLQEDLESRMSESLNDI